MYIVCICHDLDKSIIKTTYLYADEVMHAKYFYCFLICLFLIYVCIFGFLNLGTLMSQTKGYCLKKNYDNNFCMISKITITWLWMGQNFW